MIKPEHSPENIKGDFLYWVASFKETDCALVVSYEYGDTTYNLTYDPSGTLSLEGDHVCEWSKPWGCVWADMMIGNKFAEPPDADFATELARIRTLTPSESWGQTV